MNKKITALLIVLIFSVCMVGFAFAENSSADDTQMAGNSENMEIDNTKDEVIEDTSNYIKVTSISGHEFKFSDGFTGFCLDSTGTIETGDTFTSQSFANSQTENYVKLAIIEAYKLGKENSLGEIISKIVKGNMDTGDEVIKAVMDSSENIGASKTVNIDNTTEATFTFELLKSTDEDHIECLGYTVSKRTVEPVLSSDEASSNDTQSEDNNDTQTEGNGTSGNDDKQSDSDNGTPQNNEKQTDNDKKTDDNKNSEDSKTSDNKTEPEKTDNKTVVKNNNTIVKNTTTVIENNTTIVHNNVKEINNTTAPKNDSVTNLLKSGNPILILVIVAIVAIIAVVVMKRRE